MASGRLDARTRKDEREGDGKQSGVFWDSETLYRKSKTSRVREMLLVAVSVCKK